MTADSILRKALVAPVYELAWETPLEPASLLGERFGIDLWLKREDLQPVHSFKLRGALAKIASLTEAERDAGIVCASAGNHAQGVAMAARHFRAKATIVMPRTTPAIKVDAVRRLGGVVVQEGDDYDAASAHARTLPGTFVHPFDDEDVIAGQATIALELVRQAPPGLEAIYVPIGGGGLAAGIGAVFSLLRPDVRVIGVEPTRAASMRAAYDHGGPITLDRIGRFADGVAVRRVGDLTYRLCRETVPEIVTVDDDAICAAIKDLYEARRAILEPAGAIATAAAKAHAPRGATVVALACGANVDFDTLRYVSERAEIGERREAVLAVTIPERPGAFREFCRALGPCAVTEFNYRLAPGSEAHVFVGVRVRDDAERSALVRSLEREYGVIDLTDSELAKLHLRHMVGGRAEARDERLVTFEFPERSGALLAFLDGMAHPWNVSLFHYRHHGGDVGRVLAGIQVPPNEDADFRTFLAGLGYESEDVTNDPATRLFL